MLTTCTDWTFDITGTKLKITLTNQADNVYVETHVAGGLAYVGVWSSLTDFETGQAACWNSKADADPDLLASDLTEIEVIALEDDDTVDLQRMAPAVYTALTKAIVRGNEDADLIVGTKHTGAVDELHGGTEGDVIKGLEGNDKIYGGDEVFLDNDAIGDWIEGGPGEDTIDGNRGYDTIYGGSEKDTINGNEGNDTIYGDGGLDTIHGNEHDDTIYGGDENDIIDGDGGSDKLHGEDHNDTINGGADNDKIYGDGYGEYSPGLVTMGDDTLNGETGSDWIEGGQSNDKIDGGDNSDVLWSGRPGDNDQPWGTMGPNPTYHNMKGTGPYGDGDCDVEDGNVEVPPMMGQPAECPTGLPVANPDGTYMIGHNSATPLSVAAAGVLQNDTGIFGSVDPKTAVLVHPTYHGTLTLDPDGSFEYDPSGNYVGTDRFTYRVSQGGLLSANVAVVTINVTNAPPAGASDGPFTIDYVGGGPYKVTFNVLQNDSDGDGDDIDVVDPPGTDASGRPLWVHTNPSTNGTLSVDYETGEITYTYSGPAPPAMGFVSDSFQYTVQDEWSTNLSPIGVQIRIRAMPLMLDQPEVEPTAETRSITNADLALLVGEAAGRWVTAGVDPAAMTDVLAATEFVIGDLSDSILGAHVPGTIVIDVNAAGHGWFVDATAALDEEFSIEVTPSERQADQGSAAYGRADLLTVLMHELGHALGMPHLEGEEHEHSVMHDTLGLSMRRMPTAADFLAADEYFAALAGTGSLIKRRTW